jgi:hypothetical protein
MPQAVKNARLSPVAPVTEGMGPAETARYTADLLDSLRKIADRQGQAVLAHLLELARFEAHSLSVFRTKTRGSLDAGRSAQPVRVPAER